MMSQVLQLSMIRIKIILNGHLLMVMLTDRLSPNITIGSMIALATLSKQVRAIIKIIMVTQIIP